MNRIKTSNIRIFYECIFLGGILFCPGIALAASADGKAMEGMELYRQQAFDQASQKFLEAHEGKPNDPKISYNLGNSQYKQGKFEEALKHYASSAYQKFDSAVKQKSAYNAGNALFRINKLKEAIAAYKKALELDPNDMDAKFNLEFVREQLEKKNKKQKKQNNSGKDKENQQSADQMNQNKKQDNLSEPSKPQELPFQDKQEQNNSKDSPSDVTQTLRESMTKEEAEQKLSVLTEDLKKFQRKQALDMKSLFTYQGNDW